ncbi:TRAP transporter small permease [Vreelandella titanicae]|uniref:TRAP transporter small permease n=1 Tax=Vreelandella titanicae TaxID=664683 RepID=UPI00315A768F
MRKFFTVLDQLISWMSVASLGLGAIAIACLAIMGTADVIGVAVFHKPLPSALELSQIALVLVVFLGLAQAQKQNAHITVDILSQSFRGPLRRLSQTVALVAALIFFFAIGWFGGEEAIHSFQIGERSQGAMPVAVWPGRFLLSMGCWIAWLVTLRQLIGLWLWDESMPGHQDIEGAT